MTDAPTWKPASLEAVFALVTDDGSVSVKCSVCGLWWGLTEIGPGPRVELDRYVCPNHRREK